jgi:hypothetical protein
MDIKSLLSGVGKSILEADSVVHTAMKLTILISNAIDASARIHRPSFRENKPKTLIFSHRKRAFWACFRENWVYKFGHRDQSHNLHSFHEQSLFISRFCGIGMGWT